MFDTNAFNRALDTGVDPEILSSKGELFITHVQLNEIQATRNEARLDALLRVFTAIEQEKVPTSAAVWGVSEYGGAKYGDANGLYNTILNELNQRNGRQRGNTRDALIAVTAIQRNYTLVTNDSDLAMVIQSNGGTIETFEDFSS